jgi:WD40 repeat protein
MPKKVLILLFCFSASVIGYTQDVAVFPQLGHSGGVNSVAFSLDGKTVASGSGDGTIKLWDIVTGREIRTFSGHSWFVYSVAFSPDGKTVVSGSRDKTVKLWDVVTVREISTL